MKEDCIFCKIVRGEEESWRVWEDENHIAVLTPTPNTPGFTVLITKEHAVSDVFKLPEERFVALMRAARTLSGVMEKALHYERTAFIAEGMGVNHAHVKLIPLYGVGSGHWKAMKSGSLHFSESYEGFVTSEEGPPMARERMNEIANEFGSEILR